MEGSTNEGQRSRTQSPAHKPAAHDVAGVVHAEVNAAPTNQHSPKHQAAEPEAPEQGAHEDRDAHVVGGV